LHDVAQKVLTQPQLVERVKQWRLAGEKIILTNGCSDVLHVGHVR